MDKNEKKALSDIEKYGCHILHVMADESNPRFSYSIGIEKSTGYPELIITGLKQELAHWIINEYYNRAKIGEKFKANYEYSGFLERFNVIFKKVKKKHYEEYLGWAKWLYKSENFKVYQLIYPTVSGIWPWDDNAPDEYKFYIPELY